MYINSAYSAHSGDEDKVVNVNVNESSRRSSRVVVMPNRNYSTSTAKRGKNLLLSSPQPAQLPPAVIVMNSMPSRKNSVSDDRIFTIAAVNRAYSPSRKSSSSLSSSSSSASIANNSCLVVDDVRAARRRRRRLAAAATAAAQKSSTSSSSTARTAVASNSTVIELISSSSSSSSAGRENVPNDDSIPVVAADEAGQRRRLSTFYTVVTPPSPPPPPLGGGEAKVVWNSAAAKEADEVSNTESHREERRRHRRRRRLREQKTTSSSSLSSFYSSLSSSSISTEASSVAENRDHAIAFPGQLMFLPFQAMQNYPELTRESKVFYTGEPIIIKITDIVRAEHATIRAYRYVIDVEHHEIKWRIKRTYTQFMFLRRRLQLHSASLRISKKRRQILMGTADMKFKPRVPDLPNMPDMFISGTNRTKMEERRRHLERFLQQVVTVPLWRDYIETLKFLECSALSFAEGFGPKGKEEQAKKLVGRWRLPCFKTPIRLASIWERRWFFSRDTFYGWMDADQENVRNVFLIDQDFRVVEGDDVGEGHRTLRISNSHRDVLLRPAMQEDIDEWKHHFKSVLDGPASDYCVPHPNQSFAPVRDHTFCRWFVAGRDYMEAVALAIDQCATEQIFITDWWMSPELFMRRPVEGSYSWRLDRLLQRKARQGVKVYVLLYKEVEWALGLNSFHTKTVLTARHENIKVQRHPDHRTFADVFIWSHHEKVVVIDQKIAFVGGIDLCFGRWEYDYRLTDIGEAEVAAAGGEKIGTGAADGGTATPAPKMPSRSGGEEPSVKIFPAMQATNQQKTVFPPSIERKTASEDLKTPAPSTVPSSTATTTTSAQKKFARLQRPLSNANEPSQTPLSANPRGGGGLTTPRSAPPHKLQTQHTVSAALAMARQGIANRELLERQKTMMMQQQQQQKPQPKSGLKPVREERFSLERQKTVAPPGGPPPPPAPGSATLRSHSHWPGRRGSNPAVPVVVVNEETKIDKVNLYDSDAENEENERREKAKKRTGIKTSSDHQEGDFIHIPRAPFGRQVSSRLSGLVRRRRVAAAAFTPGHRTAMGGPPSGSGGGGGGQPEGIIGRQIIRSDSIRLSGHRPATAPKSRKAVSADRAAASKNGQSRTAAAPPKKISVPITEAELEARELGSAVILPRPAPDQEELYENVRTGETEVYAGDDDVDFRTPAGVRDALDSRRAQEREYIVTLQKTKPGGRNSVGTTHSSSQISRSSATTTTHGASHTTLPQVLSAADHAQEQRIGAEAAEGARWIFEADKQEDRAAAVAAATIKAEDAAHVPHSREKRAVAFVEQTPVDAARLSPPQAATLEVEKNDGNETRSQRPSFRRAVTSVLGRVRHRHDHHHQTAGDEATEIGAGDNDEHFSYGEVDAGASREQQIRAKTLNSWFSVQPQAQRPRFEYAGQGSVMPPFGRPMRPRRFSDDKRRQEEEREQMEAVDKSDVLNELSGKGMLWIGKDYYNELRQGWLANYSTSPYEDYIDRTKMPRMPWQDIAACVFGGSAADVARHFIERWNACKYEKSKSDGTYPFLLPKSTVCAGEDLPQEFLKDARSCRTQVLRSSSTWSAGLTQTEDSIHQAYVTLIQAAQRFIYIENQFYVSLTRTHAVVKNSIGDALFQRIKRAHANDEEFHIYIMLPLLPAIQGQFGTPAGAALQMVVHYIYLSISRSPDSLYQRLAVEGIDAANYITFTSVRAHGVLNNEPVTEIVYVHSKLLIIDDYCAIIGSANINDRSMLGYRDSEVCVLYRDQEFDEVELLPVDENQTARRKIKVGKFCGSLRRRLWAKYMDIEPNDARMNKPNDKVCINLWQSVARNNTQIYQDVFTCVPSDTVRTYPQLVEAEEIVDLALEDPAAAIEKLKNEIQGFLVEFPLQFLDGEDLTPVYNAKERYVPAYIFT